MRIRPRRVPDLRPSRELRHDPRAGRGALRLADLLGVDDDLLEAVDLDAEGARLQDLHRKSPHVVPRRAAWALLEH